MNRNERCEIEVLLKELGETASRMKTIALIDTRSEVPGVSLGILVSILT
jgi:hypothetical protein